MSIGTPFFDNVVSKWSVPIDTLLLKYRFDLILSNPPQQKTETLNKADKEGKLITPKVASDGGIDGFDLYNKIKNQAKEYLTEDGVLVLQHDGYTNIYKYNEL